MLQTACLLRKGAELAHVAHGQSEGAAARREDGQGGDSPQSATVDEDLLSGGSPSEGSAAGDHTIARHEAQTFWQPLHPAGDHSAEAEAEAPPGPQHLAQAFQQPLRPALERAWAQAQHPARSGLKPLHPAGGPAAEGEALPEAQHQAHTSEGLLHPAEAPCAEAKALSRVQQGTETAPTNPAAPAGASNAAAAEAVPVPPTSAPAHGRLATAVGSAARQQCKLAPAQQAGALPKQQVPDAPPQAGQYRHGVARQRSSAPSGAGQAAAAATAVKQQEAGPQGHPRQTQQDSGLQHAWNSVFPQPTPSEGLTAAIAALEAGDNGTLGAILNPTGKLQLLCSQGRCHCPVPVAEPCSDWQSNHCYAWHLLAFHTFDVLSDLVIFVLFCHAGRTSLTCWQSCRDGPSHTRISLQGGCTPPSQCSGSGSDCDLQMSCQQAASTPSSQSQLPHYLQLTHPTHTS